MRIKKWVVAIISVILILVTTTGYIALFDVYAEGEEQSTEETAPAEGTETAGEEAAPAEGESAPAEGEAAAEDTAGEPAEVPEVSVENISASSYMIMSGSTSEKIAAKHADRKMQPGKITMLVTAMVVLDNMYDDSEFNNTVDIKGDLTEYGSLFNEGESVSVGDLLDAMLVGGDEQAAEALASYSASKRKIFIKEMNSKCMELGIMDTQFTNPSGAYKNTQYSTASDLAVITQAALRYQKIKDALSQKSVKITASLGKEPREIEITSTDPLLSDDPETGYEYIKGGILGVTGDPVNAAQFAAAATKGDMQIIVILMDSAPETAAAEARVLLEYGDENVTRNTIVKKGRLKGYARVKNGAITRVAAYTETKGFAYVPPEGTDSLIQTQVFMYDDLEAPLKSGDKVGEFRIYVADELKGTVDLIIKVDVPVGWYLSRYYISNNATIGICVVLGLLLIFLLRVLHVKRRRARRREAMRRARIRELARRQLEIDENRRMREWDASGYDDMSPRTTDIRREALEENADNGGRKHRRRKQ